MINLKNEGLSFQDNVNCNIAKTKSMQFLLNIKFCFPKRLRQDSTVQFQVVISPCSLCVCLKARSAQTILSANYMYVIFQNLPGCEEIPADVIENIKKKTEVDTPLCRVKSGVDGLFVFPSVPSGEYTLVMDYWSHIYLS